MTRGKVLMIGTVMSLGARTRSYFDPRFSRPDTFDLALYRRLYAAKPRHHKR